MSLKITPLRLAVLQHLATHGKTFTRHLVTTLMPRPTYSDGSQAKWRAQGAALAAGKLMKPLREAGLVYVDHDRMATINKSGLELLERVRLAMALQHAAEEVSFYGAPAATPTHYQGLTT